MPSLLEIMKIASNEANEAGKPCAVMFGTVESVSPLIIDVEQKMKLKKEQLVLARDVTEYKIDMTVDHFTEDSTGLDVSHTHPYGGTTDNGGEIAAHNHTYSGTTGNTGDADFTHKHPYRGRKTFIVHNQLLSGEQVILIRVQGGQKFLVIDRIGVMT